MIKERILYIDDNQTNLKLFQEEYQDQYTVYITSSSHEALKALAKDLYKVVFVDYLMPEISGLDFINLAKKYSPDSLYIILTAHANLELAIKAINQGNIYRFMEKPWQENEIRNAIKSSLEIFDLRAEKTRLVENLQLKNQELTVLKEKLEEENLYLQEEIEINHDFENIVSKDPSFRLVLQKVEKVASTRATVLILGETGTGKELVARAIHKISSRNSEAFVKLNCAAIPESLIESELFGHKKGAFTGAVESKKGKFELANHGTIFLDEIGELPLHLQSKLLRVLQEGEIEKIGGNEVIHVDVRVISATNRNLENEMKQGNFRSDLYYRLNVFPVTMPPLRDRMADIKILVSHFIEKYNKIHGRHIKGVPAKMMKMLENYHWPGNIRELENIIERAIIISSGSRLEMLDGLRQEEESFASHTLEEVERQYILKVLTQTDFKVSGDKGAAKILGMKPTTLESRLNKLGISKS